jgi:hypothetical protein
MMGRSLISEYGLYIGSHDKRQTVVRYGPQSSGVGGEIKSRIEREDSKREEGRPYQQV